jgi:preprotein translocase subunit SecA
MVKEAAADPNHPAYQTMRAALAKDRGYLGPRTVVRSDKQIGRNDLCPCGSGKKYKKCCSN